MVVTVIQPANTTITKAARLEHFIADIDLSINIGSMQQIVEVLGELALNV